LLFLVPFLVLVLAQAVSFEDATDGSGIEFENVSGSADKRYIVESTGSGACLLDYDQDGLLDLYLVNGGRFEPEGVVGFADALYRNLGQRRFEDVTARAGLGDHAWGGGCAVGDVDDDGDLDLYVTNFGSNLFYVNRGDGTFEERAEASGLSDSGVSSSAAFGDLDEDGFVDLVVGTYLRFEREATAGLGEGKCFYRGVEVYCGPDGLPGDTNRLFRNRGDATFEDRTDAIRTTEAKTLGLLLADLDGDGLSDIYAACDSTINLFFRNLGELRFEDEGLLSGAGYSGKGFEQSGMGATAGDPDGDGDLDLFVTNFQNDTNTFYRNAGRGEFEDVTDRIGLGGASLSYLSWGAHFADFDNDGDEDLVIVSGHVYPQAEAIGEPYWQKGQFFENKGNDGWELVGDPGALGVARGSRGTAVGDLDDDGLLDLVVNQIDAGPSLLFARAPETTTSLKILLVGAESNRQALGAKVELVSKGAKQFRELRLSDGYLGSNDGKLHFGLGGASEASSIRIVWPSGREETLGPLAAGATYVVKEGSGVVSSRGPWTGGVSE
jgi:hypothetical protein